MNLLQEKWFITVLNMRVASDCPFVYCPSDKYELADTNQATFPLVHGSLTTGTYGEQSQSGTPRKTVLRSLV